MKVSLAERLYTNRLQIPGFRKERGNLQVQAASIEQAQCLFRIRFDLADLEGGKGHLEAFRMNWGQLSGTVVPVAPSCPWLSRNLQRHFGTDLLI